MTSTLLNISGKIDSKFCEVFYSVNSVLSELKIPYIVVGATARDLVLHHGYGARIQRATDDVDFAIEVPDWKSFNALKNKLCEQGFKQTKAQHRLLSPTKTVVDIVPFGDIENEDASIAWPPKGDVIMNVLGFKEACDNAERVRIQDEPILEVPVATPVGMSLLKIISWTDRAIELRNKDAKDIAYILSTYELIPEVKERLYASEEILKTYSWDVKQAGACLLGRRARDIAKANTVKIIKALIQEALPGLHLDLLTEEMCTHIGNDFERNNQLLSAFINGFNYKN